MKIAYQWLKNYIDLPESVEEIADILTAIGLETEGVHMYEQIPGGLAGIVIGEVLTCEKHPNAEKLSLSKVDIGEDAPVPIVCGAPNVAAGQKVVVATVNATLYPGEGEPFKIKKSKIRGEVSQGMICAEDEIGLGGSHAGIMVLDTELPNGTPAAEYFKPAIDQVIEIGLTPNRVDAASHFGVARDLKARLQRPTQFPNLESFEVHNTHRPIEVIVENEEACPRYSGVTIQGVKVEASPDWLQNRLKSIGLAPINNVVDVTNFVLHELGQPLHAFDADKIQNDQIRVKMLPQNTSFVTLDEKERKLQDFDLMICDGKDQGMCIAGVFGGTESGVTENTQDVFLEAAYFDPAHIRKTSQYHGLKTDASFRFERGVDPNATLIALKRAALLILEVAGGKIASEVVDIYPKPVANFEFRIKYFNIDRLIGKKLDRDYIQKTLEHLDIELSDINEEGFAVSVPPYRVDVQREADIIEEIARLYGLDNIELDASLGASYLANFPEKDPDLMQEQIARLLAAQGFREMMNNSLTRPEYAATLEGLKSEESVRMLNPLSEDLSVMRQTLLFSGLEAIAYNLNRRQNDLKLFEFGKAYRIDSEFTGENSFEKYQEKQVLTLFMTGNAQSESWLKQTSQTQEVSFHDLATPVQHIMTRLNLGKVDSQPLSDDVFAYGLSYGQNGKEFARLGLLNYPMGQVLDINQAVFYAELDWDVLFKLYNTRISFEEISKFPEVRRDLSLVMDKNVPFEEIRKLVFQKEKKLLKSINVFDIYEGENIGEGKRSYSVSLILEDKQQTLTDKVIDKTMKKLMQALENDLGALIRK